MGKAGNNTVQTPLLHVLSLDCLTAGTTSSHTAILII